MAEDSGRRLQGLYLGVGVRSGLVFKAHRLCASLNSRLESNKEGEVQGLYLGLRVHQRDAVPAPPHLRPAPASAFRVKGSGVYGLRG